MSKLYVVIRCQNEFERIHEVDNCETVIGRDIDCGICLTDLSVSRRHALLTTSESGCLLRDLTSRNGTRLNGKPICGDEAIPDGSEVQIGPYALQLHSSLAHALLRTELNEDSTRSAKIDAARNGEVGMYHPSLTPAQRRVYDLLITGLVEKEVAAHLGISAHTVHDHTKAIYKAMRVSTRGELVARGLTQHG